MRKLYQAVLCQLLSREQTAPRAQWLPTSTYLFLMLLEDCELSWAQEGSCLFISLTQMPLSETCYSHGQGQHPIAFNLLWNETTVISTRVLLAKAWDQEQTSGNHPTVTIPCGKMKSPIYSLPNCPHCRSKS